MPRFIIRINASIYYPKRPCVMFLHLRWNRGEINGLKTKLNVKLWVYFIVHHTLVNSLFNLPVMYSAFTFFPLFTLTSNLTFVPYCATLSYPCLSFQLCLSSCSCTSMCTCLSINSCLSVHLNISIATAASWCNFSLHSTLAHLALCILCNLSVPHQRSDDLIILMFLYLLEHHSSLHHGSYLPLPILPLFPSASHPIPMHPLLQHHKAAPDTAPSSSPPQRHFTDSWALSKSLTSCYPCSHPCTLVLPPYHSLIFPYQHLCSSLPLHISIPYPACSCRLEERVPLSIVCVGQLYLILLSMAYIGHLDVTFSYDT